MGLGVYLDDANGRIRATPHTVKGIEEVFIRSGTPVCR